jgi:hypothetical protein
VVNAALRYGAVVLLALAAAATPLATRAGTGAMHLPATGSDGPVTVFYPTDAPDQWARRGPFTLPLAEQATPVRGNGRLVVMSHGSGGTPWVHADLARALVAAGFTVAVPLHHADNALDPSRPGPDSWKLRPGEISRAIDAVGRHPQLAPRDVGLAVAAHEGRRPAPARDGERGMAAGGHAVHADAVQKLGAVAADLLGDPPGFDRRQLAAVDQRIAAYFRKHLLP